MAVETHRAHAAQTSYSRTVSLGDVLLHVISTETKRDRNFTILQRELLAAVATAKDKLEKMGLPILVHKTSVGPHCNELERALHLMDKHEIYIQRPAYAIRIDGGSLMADHFLKKLARELGRETADALEELSAEVHKAINSNRGNIQRQTGQTGSSST